MTITTVFGTYEIPDNFWQVAEEYGCQDLLRDELVKVFIEGRHNDPKQVEAVYRNWVEIVLLGHEIARGEP